MTRFALTHKTPAGANLTMLLAYSTAALPARGWLYEVVIGSDAAPANLAGQFDIIRGTAPGTASDIAPELLDGQGSTTSFLGKGGTFSVAPTKTANSAMLTLALNQKATVRWLARARRRIVMPAITDNWVGVECINHGGTPSVTCSLLWQE